MEMSDNREVVEETINAYVVQKLSDGTVRLRSGGHVVEGETYPEVLERYAQFEGKKKSEMAEHLKPDNLNNIHDGYVSLYSFDSRGFTPREILEEVTMHPYEIVEQDL